jgi:2-amino-4-hydroxy-6-hydroxymethyldihydropteridine diphosphokinase
MAAEVVHVAIGANLGDARATVQAAARALSALPGTRSFRLSPLYRSAPVDAGGPDYVNAVAVFGTGLGPRELLGALLAIERTHGRERPFRHAPRTLDLDLLLHGDRRVDEADLVVPHPRLHLRGFVLRPLLDLSPDVVVPGIGPARERLPAVADQVLERLDP